MGRNPQVACWLRQFSPRGLDPSTGDSSDLLQWTPLAFARWPARDGAAALASVARTDRNLISVGLKDQSGRFLPG